MKVSEKKLAAGILAWIGIVFVGAVLSLCMVATAHAQRLMVNEFPGTTVSEKLTKAQAQCNPALSQCVLELDPVLSVYPVGVLPSKCATCVWQDYTGKFSGGSPANQVTTTAQLVAAVAKGGTVNVGDGVYVLTSDLTIGSNTTIQCSSWSAVLTMPGVSGTHSALNILNASNVAVHGCQIDGTGMTATAQNSFNVLISNSANVDISGNYIHDCPEDCIRLGTANTGILNADKIRIENNFFYNSGTIGTSGSFVGATSASNVIISGNVGYKSLLDGVDIEPDTGGTPANGALGNQVIITGNAFDGGGGAASNCISLFGIPARGSGARFVINDNSCMSWGGSDGILVKDWSKGTITGNTVEASLNCIHLINTSLVTGTGNSLNNCSVNGILLDNSSNNELGAIITNSVQGVAETNLSASNSYLLAFKSNITDVGPLYASSTLEYSTATGRRYHITGDSGVLFGGALGHARLITNATAGSYNPVMPGGWAGIIYDYNGNDTGGFCLAPLSVTVKGVCFSGAVIGTAANPVTLAPVGTVSLSGQTAAIAATTIYTPTADGMYLVEAYQYVQTVGSSGNFTTSIIHNNGVATQTWVSGGFAVSSLTSIASNTYSIFAKAGQPIKYATAWGTGGTYGLQIRVFAQ